MSVISIRFGTSDIRDLSNGVLPASIWEVETHCFSGEARETHHYNIRSEKQKMKQARRVALGYCTGWTKRVEIRPGAFKMTGGVMIQLPQ